MTADWEIRLTEYAENVGAVRGDVYLRRLLLWVRIVLMARPTLGDKATTDLLLSLGAELDLDQKDLVAISREALRAKREHQRG
jgi:hypothetical protein